MKYQGWGSFDTFSVTSLVHSPADSKSISGYSCRRCVGEVGTRCHSAKEGKACLPVAGAKVWGSLVLSRISHTWTESPQQVCHNCRRDTVRLLCQNLICCEMPLLWIQLAVWCMRGIVLPRHFHCSGWIDLGRNLLLDSSRGTEVPRRKKLQWWQLQ